jgi:DNA polymerase III epsilon subunit-like protein
MRLLFIDTETGGLDPARHSILSLGLVAAEDGKIVDSLDIAVKEKTISAEPRALEVNGIDPARHALKAVPPAEAVGQVKDFISRNKVFSDGKGRAIPIGHNVGFDIEFVRRLFRLAGAEYEAIFSHRAVDTQSVLRFLHIKGNLPEDYGALDKALAGCGIEARTGKAHSAVEDAILTAGLFAKLLAL